MGCSLSGCLTEASEIEIFFSSIAIIALRQNRLERININMAKNCFYSFHYAPDNWRVSQVRNMGVIEGNAPARDNDWETVTKGGDAAIQKWIDEQMKGRSCMILLIGAATAGRKWINYEIVKAWNAEKGVVGIHIHNLKDSSERTCTKGANPFDGISYGPGKTLSSIVKTYDPPHSANKSAYVHISENLAKWVDEAIAIRKAH